MKLLSNTSRRFKSLVTALGMICLAQQGMATTIIQWGGNYVSSYQGIVATSSTSAGVSTWKYSTITAKSPDSSVYSGPKFYGAFSLINMNGSGTPVFRDNLFGIANPTDPTADQMRFSATAPTGTTLKMRGLVFFKKEEFLGGASVGPVTLDSDSSFKLQMTTSIGGTRSIRMAVYALVGSEWSWYLSSSSGSGQSAPFTVSDPLNALWAPYSINENSDPLNGAPPPSTSPSPYSVAGSSFLDIGAVGYFFDYETTAGASASMYLSTYEFNGNVAIPEPSTALLWLGGAAVAFFFRRFAGRR